MKDAVERLSSALEGRYRIERELGQGGMATVYLAEDLKHQRKVAIKVLRPELAAALGPERFLREISITAQLDHPHILPLLDSGQAGDFLYYVMPFVDGESLRDRLARNKQLSLIDALQITREVADALGYAHSRRVIHRDIKPDNIMLSGGHARVADFGIARALSTAGAEKLTQTGLAIGTPAYMSPEQSVGEGDLDGRSDLYSLGCVLYEMLAGEPPYSGPTAQAIIAKRFREPVPRISTLRETVPPGLEAALTRVLAKSPADRFSTAEEFAAELQDTAAEVSTPSRTAGAQPRHPAPPTEALRPEGTEGFWVAVLPFKCSAANADLAALAEGLADGVVSGLSRFSYLRVIARGSTQRYLNEVADVRTVGKELGARYVMEGNLRLAGSALRLSVRLADASSGTQLWSETYDRAFSAEAVFPLQDDLVPRIVSTVADAHGILPHTLSEALRSKDPNQLSPYEAVLRSFGYGYRMTPEEHAVVRALLERAVQQAPGYADGWGMLSLLYTEEFSNGFNARPDPLGRALQAARRAADTAPASALPYNALARALFFRKEFQAFRIAAEQALELNPMNGPTLAGLGSMMAYTGDWEHGCAIVERAARLNPRHPTGYWFALFYNAYRQGDYRGALSFGLKINLPDFFATHEGLAAAYGQLGERDAAAKAVRDLLRLKPDFVVTARDELGKWLDRDLVEQVIDGLRKAGLEIAPEKGAAPEGSSPGLDSTRTTLLPTSPTHGAGRTRRTLRAGGASVLVVSAVLAAMLLRPRPDAPAPVIGRTTQVTRDPGLEIDPALSPDGVMVAYAQGPPTRMQIYVQQVSGGRPVALTGDSTDNFRAPQWSPDGSQIAYQGNTGIFVAPALGGPLRRVVRIDTTAFDLGSGSFTPLTGLTWSPDGRRLAYTSNYGAAYLEVVPVEGGDPTRITIPGAPYSPAWSPDGTRLAVVSGNPIFTFGTGYFGNVGASSVWVVPLAGGPPVRVTDDEHLNVSPQWSADGGALYWVSDRGGSRDIYLVPLDRSGRPRGPAQRLTTGLDVHGISLAAHGTRLAYSSFRTLSNIWSIPVPRSGSVSATAAHPVTTGNQTIEGVDVSRDGRWLVFDSDRDGNPDIYKMATGGGEPTRLTADSAGDFSAAWSADGRRIAFHSMRTGNRDIFTMNADGTDTRQRTFSPTEDLDPTWSAGDSALVFEVISDRATFGILSLMGGPDSARRLEVTGDFAKWSPTGEWIAYHATDGLRLVSPSGGPSRLVVDNAKDGAEAFYGAWSPDGTTLYYLARRSTGWAIRSIPTAGGPSRSLVLFDDLARQPARYGFTTDGRTFYLTVGSHESDVWVMELEDR